MNEAFRVQARRNVFPACLCVYPLRAGCDVQDHGGTIIEGWLARLGAEVVGNTPAAARKLLREEVAKWARTIKAAGITTEQQRPLNSVTRGDSLPDPAARVRLWRYCDAC